MAERWYNDSACNPLNFEVGYIDLDKSRPVYTTAVIYVGCT